MIEPESVLLPELVVVGLSLPGEPLSGLSSLPLPTMELTSTSSPRFDTSIDFPAVSTAVFTNVATVLVHCTIAATNTFFC